MTETRPMRPVTALVAALIIAAPAVYVIAAAPRGHASAGQSAKPVATQALHHRRPVQPSH